MNPLFVKKSHGQYQAQFHSMENEGTRVILNFSSLGPQPSLNPEIWCFSPANGLTPSDPRPLFHDPIILLWCFSELNLIVETPISLVMLWWQFTEHRPPILFCCPALWIQGSQLAWKAPEFWYGSLWSCSTEGFIIHNLLKSLPQQLPKIPWWEMLLWGVPALWLTLFH